MPWALNVDIIQSIPFLNLFHRLQHCQKPALREQPLKLLRNLRFVQYHHLQTQGWPIPNLFKMQSLPPSAIAAETVLERSVLLGPLRPTPLYPRSLGIPPMWKRLFTFFPPLNQLPKEEERDAEAPWQGGESQQGQQNRVNQ